MTAREPYMSATNLPPVADISLIRLYWVLRRPPAGATDQDVDDALNRILDRARDYERLARAAACRDDAALVSLIRRASLFVNAVAVMAEDKTNALAWLADASLAVGTPDPEYACGAAYCDDPACTMHSQERHGE